jgi:nucleoid-associated protein YgaU
MPTIFERLGQIFGRKKDQPTGTAAVEPPPEAEATATGVIEAAPEPPTGAPSTPEPGTTETRVPGGPPSETIAAEPATPVAATTAPTTASAPAAEPTAAPEPTPQERLTAETDGAWAREDWEGVIQSLTGLRALQPERSGEIDEKLAAAHYNWAATAERDGDLQRALSLYRESQRRNPNLGEASFAIERVQEKLQPASSHEPAIAATPDERTYTVQQGDSLSVIAERFYGSQSEWPRIYEANRDQINDPDLIHPGQTLKIPS